MASDRCLLPTALAVCLGLLSVTLPGVGAGAGTDTPAEPPPDAPTRVLDTRAITDLEHLLDTIAQQRVVFVGEHHDRYADHLNQLRVIEGLHRRGKGLAIGMEFFQQPYQAPLDAYIAGEIDEAQMLRQTQYFDRWRFDYRLYRPILRFAREHRIPVIALNLESELTRRVGELGAAGLTPAERARLPAQIDRTDPAYAARIKAVFDQHPMPDQRAFERFVEVQLLWDEGMAERGARYLTENPHQRLVVLAGAGHIEYGQGIPKRLVRRVSVPAVTLLNAGDGELDPAAADYLLFTRPVELPAPGLLGVQLGEPGGQSGAPVAGFGPGSGAQAAGLIVGDRIVRLGDQQVAGYADIRIALLDRRPGQQVPVEVRRQRLDGSGDESVTFEVELH